MSAMLGRRRSDDRVRRLQGRRCDMLRDRLGDVGNRRSDVASSCQRRRSGDRAPIAWASLRYVGNAPLGHHITVTCRESLRDMSAMLEQCCSRRCRQCWTRSDVTPTVAQQFWQCWSDVAPRASPRLVGIVGATSLHHVAQAIARRSHGRRCDMSGMPLSATIRTRVRDCEALRAHAAQ